MRAISAVAELLLWTLRCSYEFVLLFDPPPCENKGWGRSLYQLLKLYLRPNLRNTFDGHPLRGC